jgi:hypothetical protein
MFSDGQARNLSQKSTFASTLEIIMGRSPTRRDNMIEQKPTQARRRGDPVVDEARLRQQAIGVKLRQMFDEVVSEPVPDEFLNILRGADNGPAGEKDD